MANTLLAATSSKSGSNSAFLIVILILIFGVFYFLMIRPQRNRQRQVIQVQDSVVPGQRVRTTAGMYGTVTSVEDGDVVIEVAPGVEVRYLKRAIMEVLSDAPFDPRAEPAGNGTRPAAEAEEPDLERSDAEPQDESSPPQSADETGTARDGHI
jgi:preprotein translocase subunit YajC